MRFINDFDCHFLPSGYMFRQFHFREVALSYGLEQSVLSDLFFCGTPTGVVLCSTGLWLLSGPPSIVAAVVVDANLHVW